MANSISGIITGGSAATVTLSGAASATVTADGSGNYSFTGLANGAYTVTPTKAGYNITPSSQPVTISGVDVSAVDFTASRAWLSRNNFTPSDFLHADDLNNLANDDRMWGGDVNGGGYTLSNVILVGVTTQAPGTVTSVFTRTGDVVALPTDYTPAFIGAVPTSRQILTPPGSGLSLAFPFNSSATASAMSTDITLSAAVPSVFGRTGPITLTPTDITNATGVLNTRAINVGLGLQGGGDLSANRTLSVIPDSMDQRVQVLSAGTLMGTRHAINFINGAGAAVTIVDNTSTNRVDVTIASTGSGGGMVDPTTSLGDLIVHGLSATTRLGIGTDGQVLTADSTKPLGLAWEAAVGGGGAVTSVFARTGAVVAASGDYAAAQITNAVDVTQNYANPAWITNLAWSKIISAPVFFVDPTTTKGDLIARGVTTDRLPVGADGQVLTADSSQAHGMRWGLGGGSGSQTPWIADVDAANFNLSHVKGIGIGGSAAAASATYPLLVLVSSTDVAPGARSAQVTDNNTAVQIGCSATYNAAGAVVGAPWIQAYTHAGNPTALILQPAGAGGTGVGVGKANPAYSLDVIGDVNVTGAFRVAGVSISGGLVQTPWAVDIDAASHALNNVSGIGIGGAASGPQLRINTPNPTLLFVGPTNSDIPSLQMSAGSAYHWEIAVSRIVPGNLTIRDVNGGTRLQIDNAGNIGLGHPAAYQLDVFGDVNCTGTFRVNGLAIAGVQSVFGRTGAIVAALGDYSAALVTNAVDSSQTYGDPTWITSLSWSKITGAPAAGVASVFGRVGAVTAATGDYTVAQVTGAVPSSRMIATGTGLTGGGNLSADRTLAVAPDSTNQQIQVLSGGTLLATRHAINFINGSNVTISVADAGDTINRVDVTIASTGGTGGGGMVDPTTTLGDLIVRGSSAPNPLHVGANGQVLVADSTQPLGVKWAPAAGASQSPWTVNQDAASFKLSNVSSIGVNVAATPATARVYVVATATEDGLYVVNNTSTANASVAVVNDIGNHLRILSYGSGQTTDPGIASIEATVALKFVANNSTEVMRLNSGHLLVGGTTDDGVNMVQVHGTVKSFSGGFVFPDGTTQTTAASGSGAVTSVFSRIGAVVAQPGDYTAAQVTNAVSILGSYADPVWITALAWSKITGAPAVVTDPTTTKGDILVRSLTAITRFGVGTDGQILTSDSTQTLGVKWTAPAVTSVFTRTGAVVAATGDYTAAQVTHAVDQTGSYADPPWITSLAWSKIVGAPTGGAQTPWASNIDAAGFVLNNVGQVNIQVTAAQTAGVGVYSNGIAINQVVRSINTAAAQYAAIMLQNDQGNQLFLGAAGSGYTGFPAAQRNTAFIDAIAMPLTFLVSNVEYMRITNAGDVGIGTSAPRGQFEVDTSATTDTFRGISSGQYNDGPHGACLWLIKGRGTLVSPTPVQVGDNAGHILFQAVSTGGTIANCGYITNTVTAIGTGNLTSDLLFVTSTVAASATEKMRITGQGNVCIGNAGAVLPDGNTSDVHLIVGSTASPASSEITACSNMASIGATVGMINFANYNISAADKRIAVIAANTDGAVNSGNINFNTYNAGVLGERMRITSTGNVGIQTAAPQAALDVNGCGVFRGISSQTSGQWVRIAYASGGDILCYDQTAAAFLPLGIRGNPIALSGGNVGVSTTTPAATLDVAGTIRAIASPVPTSGAGLELAYGSNTGYVTCYDRTAAAWKALSINGAPLVLNAATGSGVGIGISPAGPWLQVHEAANQNVVFTVNSGITSIQSLNDACNAYGALQYLASGHYFTQGYVGIGTTNPDQALTLDGSAPIVEIRSGGYLQLRPSANNYDMRLQAVGTQLNVLAGGALGSPIASFVAGGNVGIGTSAPAQLLSVIPAANPSTVATSNQISIGESSNNPAYRLNLGFGVIAGAWQGVIQANNGAPTGPLLLNPAGGNVGINTPNGASQPFHAHLGVNSNIVMWNSGAGTTLESNTDAQNADVGLAIAAAPLKINATNSGVSIASTGFFVPAYLLHLASDSAGKPGTNAWQVVSDVRTKQNVTPLEGGLDIIRRLPPPIVGEYNGLGGTPKGLRVVSFDLEKLREILPHAVGSHRRKLREEDAEETEILDWNSHEVLMHLILAVQQLADKANKN